MCLQGEGRITQVWASTRKHAAEIGGVFPHVTRRIKTGTGETFRAASAKSEDLAGDGPDGGEK